MQPQQPKTRSHTWHVLLQQGALPEWCTLQLSTVEACGAAAACSCHASCCIPTHCVHTLASMPHKIPLLTGPQNHQLPTVVACSAAEMRSGFASCCIPTQCASSRLPVSYMYCRVTAPGRAQFPIRHGPCCCWGQDSAVDSGCLQRCSNTLRCRQLLHPHPVCSITPARVIDILQGRCVW